DRRAASRFRKSAGPGLRYDPDCDPVSGASGRYRDFIVAAVHLAVFYARQYQSRLRPAVVAVGQPQLPPRSPLADTGTYRPEFRQLVPDRGHHLRHRRSAALARTSLDRGRRNFGGLAGPGLSAAVRRLAANDLDQA